MVETWPLDQVCVPGQDERSTTVTRDESQRKPMVLGIIRCSSGDFVRIQRRHLGQKFSIKAASHVDML